MKEYYSIEDGDILDNYFKLNIIENFTIFKGLDVDLPTININKPKGPDGEIGYEGPQGKQGMQGNRGRKGEMGDIGDKGEQGYQGEEGEPGLKGLDGRKGDKGEQGTQGNVGGSGDTGIKGEKGEKGEKGDMGFTGPSGLRGETGEKGNDGEAYTCSHKDIYWKFMSQKMPVEVSKVGDCENTCKNYDLVSDDNLEEFLNPQYEFSLWVKPHKKGKDNLGKLGYHLTDKDNSFKWPSHWEGLHGNKKAQTVSTNAQEVPPGVYKMCAQDKNKEGNLKVKALINGEEIAKIAPRSWGKDDCKVFEIGKVVNYNKRDGYYSLSEENNKCKCVHSSKVVETSKNQSGYSCDYYCSNGINEEVPIGSKCIIGKDIGKGKLIKCDEATAPAVGVLEITINPSRKISAGGSGKIKWNLKNRDTNEQIKDWQYVKENGDNVYSIQLENTGKYRFQIRDTKKDGGASVVLRLDGTKVADINKNIWGYQTDKTINYNYTELETYGSTCYCIPNIKDNVKDYDTYKSQGDNNPGGINNQTEMIGFRNSALGGNNMSYPELVTNVTLPDYYKENKNRWNTYDQSYENKCGYNRLMSGMNWYTSTDMGADANSRIAQFIASGKLDQKLHDVHGKDLSGSKESELENTCGKFDGKKQCKKRSRCKYKEDTGICYDKLLDNDFGPFGDKPNLFEKLPYSDIGKTQNHASTTIGLPYNYRNICGEIENSPLFSSYGINNSCLNMPRETTSKYSVSPNDIFKMHLFTENP